MLSLSKHEGRPSSDYAGGVQPADGPAASPNLGQVDGRELQHIASPNQQAGASHDTASNFDRLGAKDVTVFNQHLSEA